MARKTIKVKDVVGKGNCFLRTSNDDLYYERQGVLSFIETILHSTGNYNGFRYISKAEMEKFSVGLPNINTYGIDADAPEGEKFKGTDNTRIQFYS